MQSIRPEGLHVAIIMDGNGRWATRRELPRVAGHRAGIGAVRRVVDHAPDVGVGCLTLYAFSADNWRRPVREVEGIFWLLRVFLRLEKEKMRRTGVRIVFIGRRDRLPAAALREMERAERETAGGRRLLLRVAIDYSSREAIARMAVDAVAAAPRTDSDSMDGWLKRAIDAKCGEVDLLIRTGGEKRLSDFLLWELAYAELLFTERMWPEFDEADLEAALGEFRSRERRFGAVPEAPALAAASTS
jgi:undecaprenyl diphosphate synthase